MPSLLVQGCSKSKNEPGEAVPALELYSGYFFKIIKKSMDDGAFDNQIDICILSAEHGLIDSNDKIEWYDRKMDAERADELAPTVQEKLRDRVTGTYDRVIVNVGSAYNRALDGVESSLDANVHYLEGEGIGFKGNALKRVVRGEIEAVITQSASADKQ